MAFDQNKAFETNDGVIIVDGAGVFSGSASPIGSDAPIGSIYLRTNSELWRKISAGVNGWDIAISASGITNYNIINSIDFTTTSTTYVLIAGMTLVPTSGRYAVWYSAESYLNTTPKYHRWAIFKGGVIVSDSERSQDTAHSNQTMNDSTQSIINFDGIQTCEVRTLTQNGTLQIKDRSLILIRLGA